MSDEQKRAAPPTRHSDRREIPERSRSGEDPLAALTALDPAGPPAEIPLERLDLDALKVVQRLRSFGHQAYLVGGCVRDLSLGLRPKDFDVATSAHPGEIRAVFRNCRLIGRRFRLAHVYFKGGKVVETATFRANPNDELSGVPTENDLLILRDNVFGTAEEDARRRDFTINGLFYDVVLGRVIDYVGGREDLARREIRTIGDPDVRMREDPVRLLRAIRFAAKLDFTIERETWRAMHLNRAEIARCAPPRVLEEIFRLLRSGSARRCFELLHELDALAVLLPPLAAWLEQSSAVEGKALFRSLDLLDGVISQGTVPDDAVLLSTLLLHLQQYELVRHGAPSDKDTDAEEEAQEAALLAAADSTAADEEIGSAESLATPDEGEGAAASIPWSLSAKAENVEELLADLVQSARLPRKIAERARQILQAQRILSGVRKRRSPPAKFLRQPFFPDALLVFDLYVQATGHGVDALERWKARYAAWAGEQPDRIPVAALAAGHPPERPAPAPSEAAEVALEPEPTDGRKRKRRRGSARAASERHAAPAPVELAANGAISPVESSIGESSAREYLPPESERGPPPGPADLLPF